MWAFLTRSSTETLLGCQKIPHNAFATSSLRVAVFSFSHTTWQKLWKPTLADASPTTLWPPALPASPLQHPSEQKLSNNYLCWTRGTEGWNLPLQKSSDCFQRMRKKEKKITRRKKPKRSDSPKHLIIRTKRAAIPVRLLSKLCLARLKCWNVLHKQEHLKPWLTTSDFSVKYKTLHLWSK